MKRRNLAPVSLALVSSVVALSLCACTEGDLLLRRSIEDLAVTYEWQDMNLGIVGSGATAGLGNSVGLSTSFAIIGIPGASSFQGLAAVYARIGDSWTAQPSLHSATEPGAELFGYSAAISDRLAAVTSEAVGEVEIYERSGSTWSFALNDNTFVSNNFGAVVDVSEDYAIAGDPTDGVARIYHKDVTWAAAPLTGGTAPDRFGCSVSISGSYAVVGADSTDDAVANCGLVYAYQRNGTNTWVALQQIKPPTEALNGYFGRSVCVRGSTLAIGERSTSKVHFYQLSGGQWSYQGSCSVNGVVATDEFGTAVAVAGGVAATGAFGKDSKAGIVYPFELSSGSWRNYIKAPLSFAVRQADDYYGQSVSMNDDFMLVGAPFVDSGANADAGAAFFYKKVRKTGK